MILFNDIFNRAVYLFDDPDIQRAYVSNPVGFAKRMRPFLINGMCMFSNPTPIASLLSDYTDPEGYLETFDGDGTSTYVLSTTPQDNSFFTCLINGVADILASYDSTTNAVTFSSVVAVGTTCSVEWYYAGEYTTDFSGVLSSRISLSFVIERVRDILAHCLLLAWAQDQRNFLLDIRNLLTDTDFKLHSPANSVRAKTEWYQNIREGLADLTQKLSWDVWSGAIGGKQIGK